MPCALLLIGLRRGQPTPFDGQYVVEYDPDKPGTDPDGRPMLATLKTTTNAGEAKRFDNAVEALRFWKQQSTTQPKRPDGHENRPLTAFTVETIPMPPTVRRATETGAHD